MLGSGGEFAHTGNLFLVRVGIEYGYCIATPHHYKVGIM